MSDLKIFERKEIKQHGTELVPLIVYGDKNTLVRYIKEYVKEQEYKRGLGGGYVPVEGLAKLSIVCSGCEIRHDYNRFKDIPAENVLCSCGAKLIVYDKRVMKKK